MCGIYIRAAGAYIRTVTRRFYGFILLLFMSTAAYIVPAWEPCYCSHAFVILWCWVILRSKPAVLQARYTYDIRGVGIGLHSEWLMCLPDPSDLFIYFYIRTVTISDSGVPGVGGVFSVLVCFSFLQKVW